MIDLYSGTPGSGKSLHMASDIMDILKMGGLVIANFAISPDFLSSKRCKGKAVYIPDEDMSFPDDIVLLIEYWVEHHPGKKILLCLDECQNLFNARTWNVRGRSQWISFFSMHRHISNEKCNVILATQDDKTIDKQIRGRLERDFKHYKLENGGDAFFFVSFLTGRKLFKYRVFWYDQRKHIFSHVYVARKSVFKIYDTHAAFGDSDNGKKNYKKAASMLGE